MNRVRLLVILSVFCWSAVGLSEPNPVWLQSVWGSPKDYFFLDNEMILVNSQLVMEEYSRKGRLRARQFCNGDASPLFFSRDGTMSGTMRSGGVTITKNRRQQFFISMDQVIDGAFSPDNSIVALTSPKELRLYHISRQEVISLAHVDSGPFRIGSLSQNGDKLVLINPQQEVWVFEAPNTSLRKLAKHDSAITQAALSKENKFVLSTSQNGALLQSFLAKDQDLSLRNLASDVLAFHLSSENIVHILSLDGKIYQMAIENTDSKNIIGTIVTPLFFSNKVNHLVPCQIVSAKWASPSKLLLGLDKEGGLLLFDLTKPLPKDIFLNPERGFFETSLDLLKLAIVPLIPALHSSL